MLKMLEKTNGSFETVNIDKESMQVNEDGVVISFAAFSHNESGHPHYHIYKLTRDGWEPNRHELNTAIARLEKGSVAGGGFGAMSGYMGGVKEVASESQGPSAARLNKNIVIERSVINGAVSGAQRAVVVSLLITVGLYMASHLKKNNHHQLHDLIYINVSDADGSEYKGPWRV